MTPSLELEWDHPLNYRKGGYTRLDDLDVFYEFNWYEILGHDTAQFTHGQCLAQFVRESCPEGKTPILLLTGRDDVHEGSRETETQFVFVLNLPRYVKAHADAALSYLASRVGPGIIRINELTEMAEAHPELVRSIIRSQLQLRDIAVWASENVERIEQLRSIPGVTDGASEPDLPGVISALEALGSLDLDHEAVEAVTRFFGPGTDRDLRIALLRAITEDPDGRYVTGEIVVERAPDRIADARSAIAEYQKLLDDPKSSETELQTFIESHAWLLGLEYVRVRPRTPIPRGTAADFILERYDGFHDLLELKSPQDDIIRAPDPVDGVSPSASNYKLSSALAQALAQVHVYRDVLTRGADSVLRLYGLERTRDPRVIIVVGKAPPPHRAEVLRELNKSLHRVEIVPYDALAERGEAMIDNVVRYLVAAEAAASPPE